MPRTKTEPEGRKVYVPTDSFGGEVDGIPRVFKKDITRVREGHPLLVKYGHLFREIRVDYEWEQATNAPGEQR
jgi:hypothetical protein